MYLHYQYPLNISWKNPPVCIYFDCIHTETLYYILLPETNGKSLKITVKYPAGILWGYPPGASLCSPYTVSL